jgi:uncharacterized Rmd1/YagE family protein
MEMKSQKDAGDTFTFYIIIVIAVAVIFGIIKLIEYLTN